MNKILLITYPYPVALLQARQDEAIVTGRPLVERPFYFKNTETDQDYYDLCGCIGWPSEISEQDQEGLPGYLAIIGIVKSKKEEIKPQDAVFQLLAEYEHRDVPTLIEKWLVMRAEYGFDVHPDLLQTLFGDPERFLTTMALKNEILIEAGGEKAAILVAPPDDFYDTMVFDNYLRALRSVFVPQEKYKCLSENGKDPLPRFFHGNNKFLKNRLKEFKEDDPAVMAVGGLVHSLMSRCLWMDQTRENAFTVEEVI